MSIFIHMHIYIYTHIHIYTIHTYVNIYILATMHTQMRGKYPSCTVTYYLDIAYLGEGEIPRLHPLHSFLNFAHSGEGEIPQLHLDMYLHTCITARGMGYYTYKQRMENQLGFPCVVCTYSSLNPPLLLISLKENSWQLITIHWDK